MGNRNTARGERERETGRGGGQLEKRMKFCNNQKVM